MSPTPFFSKSLAALGGGFLVLLVAAVACSSGEGSLGKAVGGAQGEVPCEDKDCLPGNKCLALEGVRKCRKTCASNVDPASSCPFGYTCVANDPQPFCVKDAGDIKKKPSGQWGDLCPATDGIENPACDAEQSFLCYATGKGDGAAYCTRYDCSTDRDCAAGFWCATVNLAPNALTDKPTVGETGTVCLKREYCSTCKADLDCPPYQGRPQHCIGDKDGKQFCSPECTSTKNCNLEAKCLGFDGFKACYPNAEQCVGDGSVCAPCRSDVDCPNGACVKGQYTTERLCTVHSKKTCSGGNRPGVDYDCPDPKPGAAENRFRIIRCLGGPKNGFEQAPANECHGIYFFGNDGNPADPGNQPNGIPDSADIGCYTPPRTFE